MTDTPHSSSEKLLRRLIWGSLAAIVGADALAMWVTGFRVGFDGNIPITCVAVVVLVAAAYGVRRTVKHDMSANGFEAYAQYMVFVISYVIFSYFAFATSLPLRDAWFIAADRFLGFDWLAYLGFVNQRPWLNTIFNSAYHSLMLQIYGLIVLLCLTAQYTRLYHFILSSIGCALVCIALAALLPSLGAYAFLGIVDQSMGYVHLQDVMGMREGTLKHLPMSQVKGIITFPSFHSSLALLFMWGYWGIRWLRWPFMALNIVMLLSVPATGGHYLVDVIAGVAIAAIIIFLVKKITRYKITSDVKTYGEIE